ARGGARAEDADASLSPPAGGPPPRVQDAAEPPNLRNRSVAARTDSSPDASPPRPALGAHFWAFLGVVLLFTLGNSTDAFLILRANQLGIPVALVPILWAMLHVVKSASSTPGGALSDRLGRKPLIVAGWLLYASVYFAFARASEAWQGWALFAIYGVYFGLVEGTEKALVADVAPAARRGTAFGWYNLAVGLGALPASLLFGAVWDRLGPAAAFQMGAALALAAALGMAFVAPAGGRDSGLFPVSPGRAKQSG
ncbi:MAG TPA: MFS transporter, partial [Gemmatimonadaceae bacterium]|nr:MFS transporter [Gemmatimonadaceae bacterium]